MDKIGGNCSDFKNVKGLFMEKEKLIVVTGGAGFIGSCSVRYLNDQGYHRIVIVDELGNSEKWKNLVGKKFVEIVDKDKVFSWLEGRQDAISGFLHLGACTSTVETDATFLLNNNFRYSVRLAEYALKHSIRFVYASSAATYGDGRRGFSDNHEGMDHLAPLNMYGYSKHLFDLWARDQGILGKVVGLKYFNVFGPNEGHKGRMASAIKHMLPVAQKDGRIALFKSNEPEKYRDGDQCRDFVYVKDVAKMNFAFLVNPAISGGIYNIGTGRPSTWNQLARALFKSIDKPPLIDYIEMPHDLWDKYQNYTCADMQKTKGAIGDAAGTMSLEDAISDYVCNHLIPGRTW